MTQSGIEPQSPGPLANTQLIRPMARLRNTYDSFNLYMVIVNGMRTIYPCGLNIGFNSKSCSDSQVQHETPEEGKKMHQLNCEYNTEDEYNSLNILSDKKKNINFCLLVRDTYKT